MAMNYVQIITNIPASQVINTRVVSYDECTDRVSLNSSTFCHEFGFDVLHVIVLYA